ncbi:MAG: DUF92 domain-containing protein [Clostridia bacterium]|nr:DUF92 domain-containing protein [Clostridia bacterium]
MIIKGYLFSIIYAVLCLALGFGLYKLRCQKAVTRKVVHILIGFEWFILYHFFGGGIHFLLVCLLFLAVLIISHYKKLLPMIESDSDNSLGTVYYAVAMSVMATITLFLPNMILPFGIGVICTSLGDGFAGLIGGVLSSRINGKIYGNKTIYGSIFNFLFCFVSIWLFQKTFAVGINVCHIAIIALFATELELFTGRGLDNITITVGSSLLSYFFIHSVDAYNYVIPILLTPIMIAFAYKKQALTKSGIVFAVVVDIIISFTLGNFGFLLLFAFFVLGLMTDKIKRGYKNKGREVNEAPSYSPRDYRQVLANSLVATISSVLFYLTASRSFLLCFVVAFAEALADTAASGIGSISKNTFDPFRMCRCESGLSGGMSLLGTVASVPAAAIIGIIAYGFSKISLVEILIITLAAFLGALFDSLLGSIVQVKFRCRVCNEITEEAYHCGIRTVRHSGISFVDNNIVNFLSTLFAAIIILLFYM